VSIKELREKENEEKQRFSKIKADFLIRKRTKGHFIPLL
jgi:thermostable 8-oxoguanine DNA glycosylase